MSKGSWGGMRGAVKPREWRGWSGWVAEGWGQYLSGGVFDPVTRLPATPPPVRLRLVGVAAAGARAGAGFGLTAFEDALAHVLGGGLDFLHLLADARAGGLVAPLRLGHVVGGFHHQLLQLLVFLHGVSCGNPFPAAMRLRRQSAP